MTIHVEVVTPESCWCCISSDKRMNKMFAMSSALDMGKRRLKEDTLLMDGGVEEDGTQ